MKPGEPIEIYQADNGFIVTEVVGELHADDRLVFCSFADLAEWLAKHFEVKHD